MAKLALEITSDEIVRWSQQYDAPFVLPDLVRRLLLATSSLSGITMAAHAGTRLPGWDGVVRSSKATPFCPAGVSVWELTVEDTTTKLVDDLSKRTLDPGGFPPRDTTYLAVSARRVRNKVRWAADETQRGPWRDVRLLDADDLAAWLAVAPAVARWFAAKIGHPAADADDLDGYLAAWRARTQARVPIEAVLAGRERQQLAESVRAWARRARADGLPLRVHAETWEEAGVFAAAALATDESMEGLQTMARTVIVRSEEALRAVLRAQQMEPLVVLAAFANVRAESGRVVIPMEGPLPSGAAETILRLNPVPHQRLAEMLIAGGMPEAEAQRVASASGGSLIALQRLLGYVALPSWAANEPLVPLSALLLVGAFDPESEADREALRSLGADPREVEILAERLRLGPESPTHKDQGRFGRGIWNWVSPRDAWNTLAGQLPADVLRRFEKTAVSVLGEPDPSYELVPNERFAAAVHGKILRHSPAMRDGVARSLVQLALHDDSLAPVHGQQRGSTLALLVVRALLPPRWEAWASLSPLLPLLAEAAPDEFLDALETSLREGAAGAAKLLSEESSFGSSPHTGLLWALETLGWDEHLMPRVASAFARLAQHDTAGDRPGRLANRPAASLAAMLGVFFAQTAAPAEQRIQQVRRLLSETEEVAFSLLLGQFASGIGIRMPAKKPEVRPMRIPTDEEQGEETRRFAGRVLKAYIDMAIDHAGEDAARWAALVEQAPAAPILGPLEKRAPAIVDAEARLWGAVRHVIHLRWDPEGENVEGDADGEQASGTDDVARWRKLYEDLQPADLVLRHAWLFSQRPELPEPFRADWEEEMQELARRRLAALEEIGAQGDRLAVLTRLIGRAEDRWSLGWALGQTGFAPELDQSFLAQDPGPPLAELVPAFVCGRFTREHWPWLETALRALVAAGRAADVGRVLLVLPSGDRTWDLADALGPEVCGAFWSQLGRVFGEHKPETWERAVASLVEAGNLATAVEAAQWARGNIASGTVARALGALLGNVGELLRFGGRPASSYTLEKLMDRLEADPQADQRYAGLLASVELAYALKTREPRRALRRLSAAFAASPDQFVNLVSSMYRPSGEPPPERSPEEQAAVRESAQAAYRVLDAWKGFPGEGRTATEREEVLHNWGLSVLRLLAAAGRPATGVHEVARVLARAPGAEDGTWPCFAARRLIESGEFPDLARGLHIAKYNARGMTSRSLGEGGTQERALTAGFRDAAARIRSAWPRTADLLDGLAEDYEGEAAREDEQARTTMRQEGAEPEDFGSPPKRLSPKRRVLSPGLVHIGKIELADFAIFEKLELAVEPPTEKGQWLLVLGDNGRGKTTLLRALAMALTGINVAQWALGEYRTPLIRVGQTSAKCLVTSAGDRRFSLVVSDEEGTGETAGCEPEGGARPLVFGYGCRRGSALGGAAAADLSSISSDVATLFSGSAGLQPADAWLSKLKTRAIQNPAQFADPFKRVCETLCGLLPDVERLDVVDAEVWAIAPKLGGRVPLRALSDGYLTTIGWVADLVARWLFRAEQMDWDTSGDFFARMEGLVLLDELDLHLHPRWQQHIVRDLKTVFPRMSFIATTHNPITLLGADPGEIVILDMPEGERSSPVARKLDLPKGIDADRILTGEWFGLESTADAGTLDLVHEHQQMLLNGVAEEDPGRRKVEEKLAHRYGTWADTSLDRMALELVAQVLRGRGGRRHTPRERAEVLLDVAEGLRERILAGSKGES